MFEFFPRQTKKNENAEIEIRERKSHEGSLHIKEYFDVFVWHVHTFHKNIINHIE